MLLIMNEKTYTVEQFRLAVKQDIQTLGSELENELQIRRNILVTH